MFQSFSIRFDHFDSKFDKLDSKFSEQVTGGIALPIIIPI